MHTCEVHAYEMCACEVHTYEMYCYEVDAHEVYPYEMRVLGMHAGTALGEASRFLTLPTVARWSICRDLVAKYEFWC
jgi:hypothetical protein